MARRARDPFTEVVQYFMQAPLVAVEQALVTGKIILNARHLGDQPPADVGAGKTAPVRRRRRRAAAAAPVVEAPPTGQAGQAAPTPQEQAAPPAPAQFPRRRASARPPTTPVSGAMPPLGTGTTAPSE
jgi:hypothetical protein